MPNIGRGDPQPSWREITRARSGFTLIELVMVIVIIAALSAIVVPQYRDYAFEANASAMASTVKSVRSRIKTHFSEFGVYPNALDPNWFSRPLLNIWASPVNAGSMWTSTLPINIYPSDKTFNDSSPNTMWYNRINGSFCVKVPPQASTSASLQLFNRVNQTEATTMAQTK